MNLVVQKYHSGAQVLYKNVDHSKKRRHTKKNLFRFRENMAREISKSRSKKGEKDFIPTCRTNSILINIKTQNSGPLRMARRKR